MKPDLLQITVVQSACLLQFPDNRLNKNLSFCQAAEAVLAHYAVLFHLAFFSGNLPIGNEV